MNSIISDLKRIIEGDVSHSQNDLAAVSQDFGGVIQKQPLVIVRPQNSTDVAKAVNYAATKELTISARGAGNSLNGRCLNQGGILLDMRSLNQIYELNSDGLWFKADAGVTWKQLVNVSLPHGVIPPVLTNNLNVTLGGTHAAGGLGQYSFRHGSQADNCLALEVVTGTGERVWCTREENSELFDHVLCGYGQFGIITQIKHRLRKYRPLTRTYFLCYDDLERLLQDKKHLVLDNQIDGLQALFSPSVLGFSRSEEQGIKPLIQWFYTLQITQEVDSVNDINQDKLLSSLNFYRHIHTQDIPFDQFVLPVIEIPPPVNTVNPWIDILLPESTAKDYMETTLKRIPAFLDFKNTFIGSYCLISDNTNMPMFPLPKGELIFGFGMYPILPKSKLKPVLEQLNKLTDLGFQMQAKRCMTSWVEFDLPQWRLQFGDYWSKVNEMKGKYDPNGILNPDFFQYEPSVKVQRYKQPITLTETVIPKSAEPMQLPQPVTTKASSRLTSLLSVQVIALAVLTLLVFLLLNFPLSSLTHPI
ncbi:FAD binding domain protein [Coleofasciculus chthonoplastes PCC 7420]|uniref:FAD binding domain protein n=1 Tax=Coleofasciculus chthonoplastes PCC 7420 TaxID=118168 RepID=B4VVG1_9CYAN|nr:FAD-binding protein [Coleofasciculus chthonoplastes]EDX74205.1 FAD binding domain protein [Coleofasciculus chthonoplastes PCC 7420]